MIAATGDPRIVEPLRAAGCVFAEDEAALLVEAAAGDGDDLRAMLERRVAGEPLEHVVGWAQFRGLRIEVGPGVFVPRPRTEALVGHAAMLARDVSRPIVVDLCCGSGALGVALASELANVELHASDIDPVAVAFARRNVGSVAGRAYVGDMADALPRELRGRVDVLVANVPYVPTCDIELLPREARKHEPRHTLDGGEDGLDLARGVAEIAAGWLAPGGHVLIEVTPEQARMLTGVFEWAALAARTFTDDELDATVVVGTRHA